VLKLALMFLSPRFEARSRGDRREELLGAREVPWLKVWSSE